MRVPRTLVAVAATVSLGLALGGCSGIQESLECPGDDCPETLQGVLDTAASVDGVTKVDRAWRFSNIDRGASGGIDVRASVTTQREAESIARELDRIYEGSSVEDVDRVSVLVVPDPERSEPDDAESTWVSRESTGGAVPCAATSCRDEVAAFEDAFAQDPVAEQATLGDVTWSDDGVDPQTSIEVTAGDEVMDATELDAFRDRIQDIAEAQGISDIGTVRTIIHYDKRVEFTFPYDVAH